MCSEEVTTQRAYVSLFCITVGTQKLDRLNERVARKAEARGSACDQIGGSVFPITTIVNASTC